MNTTRHLQLGVALRPLLWALAVLLAVLLLFVAVPDASAQESPHQEQTTSSSTCSSCHSVHAWPTDGSADTDTGAICLRCHTIAVASDSADPLTRHDIGPSGTIYCAACHSPHSTSAAMRTVDPLDRSTLLPSALVDVVGSDGAIYALVGSQNDSKDPVISGLALYVAEDGVSATVTWTTDERASSWVDWGLTEQYELGGTGWEQPFGSAELTESHWVTMTGLTPGTTYHYRVRSADALGNASTSEDRTFTTPFPYEPEGAAASTTTPDPGDAFVDPTAPEPASPESASPPPASGATLVYADEFDGPLNTSVWQQLTPWETRYTTGELQYYAPENVSFTGGNMRILTERRSVSGYNYASGIVTSLPRPFSYGYFESRFNMPTGKGLWPAFWLTNDRTHEIDMMELLGEDPTRMYFTYHKGGNQLFQRSFDNDTDLTAGWHTVGMDWQPSYIRWYLDGQLVAEYTGDIISDPMYLIFNTAVGGAWAVDPDSGTPFPQTFEIDYVRVYDHLPEDSLVTAGALAADSVTWRPTHLEYTQYSVDTDRIALAVDTRDGEREWLAPAAGWQSAGPEATKPRPSDPGSSVEAATLERAATDDDLYWRTAISDTDREWNWQVVRFDLGTTDVTTLENLSLLWSGHGEPTAGYPTALYVWEGGDWTLVSMREAPEDISLSLDRSSVDESFCLSCHQGPPPEGVVMPDGVTDVGAGWQADLHGWGAGEGFGGNLSAPYARASEAVGCSTCHDPHGSSSIYHIPESVNATQTAVVTSGSELRSLCVSCHEGSLNDWHSPCVDCHTNGHWAGWVDPPVDRLLPTESSDCTQCHGHSQSWTHPATCLRCHGETELRNLNAAPDQPWTYNRTF